MSPTQITVLAVAAVLVFWTVGAYNRLVALRNAIGAAWLLVDEVLTRRGDAIRPLAVALREPLASEQGALDALLLAEQQVRTAALALGLRPVAADLAASLVAAEAGLASAASRVLALLAQHPDAAGNAEVSPYRAVLEETGPRLAFVRQLFNDAAEAYNAAAGQFPTRLLTQLFGFGAAGRI